MLQLYDFGAQADLIKQMQETSLLRDDMGLAPDPLVGSGEWRAAIERGDLRRCDLSGVIARDRWGSMSDWPKFELRGGDGNLTTWTREGDARRFVAGLDARLVYVEHPWKPSTRLEHIPGDMSKVVLGIWIEDGPLRSSAFAPGPGGAGYRLARERGEAAHFLYAPDRAAADKMLSVLQGAGRSGRVWGGGTPSLWIVEIWAARASEAKSEAAELHDVARSFGGRYDGGEIIEGEIWGRIEA
jgi:hypothetical protein